MSEVKLTKSPDTGGLWVVEKGVSGVTEVIEFEAETGVESEQKDKAKFLETKALSGKSVVEKDTGNGTSVKETTKKKRTEGLVKECEG